MTLYDPYVNMLRSATESMSAILGGIDSLTVEPFNRIIEADDPFATRIARNQQLLLKEESYLDKVVDPGAGSYYLEALTASLIEQAWQTFLQTEEKGGFLQAFLNGEIQGMIRDTAQKRQNAISTKKEILLGVNQYPDFREKIGTMLPEDKVFPEATVHTGRIAEPLPRLRGAAAFEKLRYRTDQYALKHERPRIFMLTYGNLAMRRARAQFACNFFACGGFEVIDNIGFGTLDEGILEARHSKPHAVVLCSSDDEYGEVTRGIVEELNSFSIAVVAGMPKDFQEQLQAYGVRYFIHVRANILDLLMEFQKEFGIERR
jgi:methylmalonyl-CoA mutase